jgi:hypothetical protein
MENIETVTPEQIAKHYSSALDSVALINAGQPDGMDADEWADTVSRNKEHLEIMVAKDFWTDGRPDTIHCSHCCVSNRGPYMSTVVSKNVQIGADGTASNNFTAYQPSTPDGTLRIGNGNSGSVTDAIVLNSSGVVSFTNNPTLSAGTANGVAYLNGSKVLTSGSALTFDGSNLSTTGQVLLENNNYIGFKNTTGTYAASIFNDTSNYLNLYNSGNTGTIFYVNAAEQMRLTSTGLGIGTSSPQASAKLHVYAAGDYTDESAPFTLGSSSTGDMRLYAGVNNTNDYTYIGSVISGIAYSSLVLQPNGGNVGIGTSSPSVRLHVDGDIWMDAAGATRLKITHVGGGEAQIDNPTAALRFATGSTERARIDSSGNVVLGTSANGGQVMTTLQGYSPNSTNGSYGNLLFSANSNYTGGASRFLLTNAFNATDFAIISSVNATTTPTLDSGGAVSSGTVVFSLKAGGNAAFAGNIGIGGTTPATSGTGITFPATQSASSDANTLDDYEEGTWTPTITFNFASTGITYTTQLGRYVKIGRQVTIWVYFLLASKGSDTGPARVMGLPFTNSAGNDAEGASFIPNYWGMASSVTPGGYVQAGQSYFILINTAPATSVSTITDSNFTNTTYLYGCATYTV